MNNHYVFKENSYKSRQSKQVGSILASESYKAALDNIHIY